MPIAPLPKSLAAMLSQEHDTPTQEWAIQTIPEGDRHRHMLAVAGSLRRRGASVETIRAALQSENETRFSPPLDDEWVEKIVHSADDWAPGAPNVQGIATGVSLTDEGNAKRFVAEYGPQCRYDGVKKEWRRWDGQRWALDERNEVEYLARQVVEHIHQAADLEDDEEQKKVIRRWAKSSEGGGRIDAMLKLSRSTPDIVVRPQDYDADPYELVCANGVLDLRSGDLLPHDSKRLVSRACPWPYDVAAPEPKRWLAFLEKVQPNPEIRLYLQKLFGYCLSGLTDEQQFWVWWGDGSNGKSVALDVLRGVLGEDYTLKAPKSLLREHKPGQITNDIATLPGYRAVIYSEFPRGDLLDMDLVKDLTGERRVTARHLYESDFTFTPSCKLIVTANNRPRLDDSSEAVWRRMRLVPWEVKIAAHERIQGYDRILLQEAPGILKWIVDGWWLYADEGLEAPKAVLAATDTYKTDSDLLQQFTNDRCDLGPDLWCRFSDLLTSFHSWAIENGLSPRRYSRSWLKEELGHHRHRTETHDGNLSVEGIALRVPGGGRSVEVD